MNQEPHTVHPLVARYLQDLDVLLRGIEPVERAEVVEGVREHIEASLHRTARTDADVRPALAKAGPARRRSYRNGSPVPAPRGPETGRFRHSCCAISRDRKKS
jgi:hypothetical protein